MEWVLVNRREHEIVSKYKTDDKYGLEAAKFYFMGRKQISEQRFDELWTVMTEKEFELKEYAFRRKSSSDPNRQWWKEEGDYLDMEKT